MKQGEDGGGGIVIISALDNQIADLSVSLLVIDGQDAGDLVFVGAIFLQNGSQQGTAVLFDEDRGDIAVVCFPFVSVLLPFANRALELVHPSSAAPWGAVHTLVQEGLCDGCIGTHNSLPVFCPVPVHPQSPVVSFLILASR